MGSAKKPVIQSSKTTKNLHIASPVLDVLNSARGSLSPPFWARFTDDMREAQTERGPQLTEIGVKRSKELEKLLAKKPVHIETIKSIERADYTKKDIKMFHNEKF